MERSVGQRLTAQGSRRRPIHCVVITEGDIRRVALTHSSEEPSPLSCIIPPPGVGDASKEVQEGEGVSETLARKHTSGPDGGASGRSHWGSPGRRASLITAAETMSGNDAQDPSASNDNSYIIQHLSLGCTVISSLARGLSVAVRWWPHNRKALILSLRSAAASMTSPAKRGEGREGGEGRREKNAVPRVCF